MSDTTPEVKKIYQDMLMSRTPSERLGMASRMFDTAKSLCLAGILKERQGLDQSQVHKALFLRIYGNDFSDTHKERIIKKIFQDK
ncbi:MAG: hypothetical protein JW944_13830 [Deltaproteobacteria bacterium]|nr:hypothetical protein [Deltaproteobacteria bacterium]